LGGECSQDEQGTAAYKTVELDDLFGDLPVQFRETQGNESPEFLSLFKTIHVLKGGVASGFNKVKPTEYKAKLLHIKGVKDNVRVSEVALDWKSLNAGDVFVLDNGLEVFIWNGPKGGIFEKRKAQDVVNHIRESRQGKPKITILDGLEDNETFWKILGGKPSKDELPKETPDDDKSKIFTKSLWRLSDASGDLKLSEVANGSFKKNQLDTSDVFLVDAGEIIYVWVGKGTTKNEKISRHPICYLVLKTQQTFSCYNCLSSDGRW